MRSLIILLFLLGYSIVFSQNQSQLQTIFMRAGFQFSGEIVDYSDDYFYIRLESGKIVKQHQNRIKRITDASKLDMSLPVPNEEIDVKSCLLYTSPSPRDRG